MLNITLNKIMTQGYLYVEEHESMGKAFGILRDRRISCLFVLKDDMPVGIITERKIMEKAVMGMEPLSSTVRDVMSGPLLTLLRSENIADACELMSNHEIRHVGIVDEHGRLKGTVTPGNIVSVMGSDSFSSSALVRDIMYPFIVLTKPDSNLKEVCNNILEKRSCCAIVMDGNKPIGLVSEKDVARCLGFGQNIENIPLEKIMSSPVITVLDTDSVAHGIITLQTHHIHRAVVMDNQDEVVGTLALNNYARNIDTVLNKKLSSYSF